MIEAADVRLSIRAAIAWTILAEIVRTHDGAADLRVIEMHPGGGQGHILRIYRLERQDGQLSQPRSNPLGEFSLISGRMRGFLPGHDANVNWLGLWLENPDVDMVVDVAIQTMALPVVTKAPPTSRRTFGYGLLAALLGAKVMDRDYLVAKMAFVDTSGFGGGVSAELAQFSGLYSRPLASQPNDESFQASDCWLLYAGWQATLIGALRVDGLVSSASSPSEVWDAFPTFERAGSMLEAVAQVRRIWSV